MAEGGILEKFPDSWDPQYLWSVVVEYLLNDHPIDILIKRLVFYRYIHYFNVLIQDESLCVLLLLYIFFVWVLLASSLKWDKISFKTNHHIIFLIVFLSTHLSTGIFLSYQSR